MMDDLALALPSESGHVTDVHRIAAGGVVQVAENRFEILRPQVVHHWMVQRARHGEIESLIHGEEPTAAAKAFCFGGEAGAVGTLLRPTKLVVCRGNEFRFATGQEQGFELIVFYPAGSSGEGIAADGAAVALIETPPTPPP